MINTTKFFIDSKKQSYSLSELPVDEYQRMCRVYGDELPLANWCVIHAGMKTMYWKIKQSDIK